MICIPVRINGSIRLTVDEDPRIHSDVGFGFSWTLDTIWFFQNQVDVLLTTASRIELIST